MTGGLTRQQRRALLFIRGYIAENGISPSYDEIMQGLGLGSKSGVHRLVKALEARRKIQMVSGRARSIELVGGAAIAFHLRSIVSRLNASQFLSKDDPIIADAMAALEEWA